MDTATFIQRLSSILAALAALVAARLLHHPTLARQIVPLWTYITHVAGRVERALAHPPRPRRPCECVPRPTPEPEAPSGESPSPEPPPPAEENPPRRAWRLPTSKIWLIRILGYEAAGYASQLRCLLAEPGAQALLAASPAAVRHLKPLMRILIPSHWDNPFSCAQRPAPKPGAPPPQPLSREKLA